MRGTNEEKTYSVGISANRYCSNTAYLSVVE